MGNGPKLPDLGETTRTLNISYLLQAEEEIKIKEGEEEEKGEGAFEGIRAHKAVSNVDGASGAQAATPGK